MSELHKSGIKTPVIIATNLAQKEDVEKAKKLGAVDYFVKSDTSLAKLVEYIQKILA